MCCRQPRRLYASRYCELKRFVGSSGGCSRAAEGHLSKQFEISTDATDAPKVCAKVCTHTNSSRTPSRHGRTRAPQPRRRSRAQLSERHSATLPRRVGRRTAAFGRQSCGTEGARLLIQDLAAAARQVSAARPMRAGVLSSDRAPSPGWDRDARRKVPSRADGERSVALRSPSDRAARRRACADARASVRSPGPLQAAICPSWR